MPKIMTKKIVKEKEESKKEIPVSPASDHTPEEKKEIRIIERIIENKEIAPIDAFGKLSRTQIQLIKTTIAKGASDDELRLFIQVCKGANLNPFLKQVHLVPRWDSREGKYVRAIQVSIDGFRSIAESSGAYAGNDDPIFDWEQEIEYMVGREKKKLTIPTKATVTVYKIVEGQRYPFNATARWSEYYPGEKMGFQWHIRPFLMLGKCAEALALRKAFPKLLSGMYAQEEMERGSEAVAEQAKVMTAYQKLSIALQKMGPEELEDWVAKITKSDKYSDTEKKELLKIANTKLEEFMKE